MQVVKGIMGGKSKEYTLKNNNPYGYLSANKPRNNQHIWLPVVLFGSYFGLKMLKPETDHLLYCETCIFQYLEKICYVSQCFVVRCYFPIYCEKSTLLRVRNKSWK